MKTTQSIIFGSLFGLAVATSALPAAADQINTGGQTGAYHGEFCPLLEKALTKAQFPHKCTTSAGSRDNISRVTGAPTQVGYSQLDVFALETSLRNNADKFQVIRTDLGKECVFMVTKNKELETFGQVSALAPRLRFVLPPEASGSTATFHFLQQVDPEGLGRAVEIAYADSADAAIQDALSRDDAVTLFVQFPDPDNARFKQIAALGGHFVPVIDRNILRQQIGGEKVYFAEETEIANANWLEKSKSVVTACTPMLVFTAASSQVAEGKGREDHVDLVKTIQAIPASELIPSDGFFSRLLKRTKQLSAQSVEKLMDVSEEARVKAQEMSVKAKELGEKALEKAGEATEQAKEKARELMNRPAQ